MFTVYNIDDDSYSTVEEPDPSVTYTYADYLQWKFEERLELFRGKIFKLSAPNTKHQAISRNLSGEIFNLLKKGKCKFFTAPFDVRLPVQNKKKDAEINTVVQPDICIICDPSKIDARGCCGAPDLVVEILSPGNSKKEVKLKFALYEEAGVREYWIVYPEEESIAVFLLKDNNKYDGALLYAGDEIIVSNSVPGFSINLADIFTK
ncbi:MAG TPA: Uma2 family endonuclease [Chitinophagaceae bacterium]